MSLATPRLQRIADLRRRDSDRAAAEWVAARDEDENALKGWS